MTTDETSEVAIQPSLPTLSLPEFEGRKPVGVITRVNGAGSRIHRAMLYGEKVILVVEGEITHVDHGKTGDGMKRIQTVAVRDLFELEGKPGAALLRSLRQAYKLADDARGGKKGLPLSELEQPDDTGAGLEVTVDANGTVLTSAEAAEARGEILPGLPHVDVAVLVFDDGSRALWPDDFADAVGPHPEAGERIHKPGTKAKDDPVLVRKVLDADTGEELEEWTDEQENTRLAELEAELEREEADAAARKSDPPLLPGEDDDLADVATMNTKRLDASRIMANPDGPGVRAAGSIKSDLSTIEDVELVREIRNLEELGGARKTLLVACDKRIEELEAAGS